MGSLLNVHHGVFSAGVRLRVDVVEVFISEVLLSSVPGPPGRILFGREP